MLKQVIFDMPLTALLCKTSFSEADEKLSVTYENISVEKPALHDFLKQTKKKFHLMLSLVFLKTIEGVKCFLSYGSYPDP